MKRTLTLILALLMVLSLFAGCGQSKTPAATEAPAVTEAPAEPTEEPAAAASVFPLTVTDQIGNEVTLEAPAARIVSGYYISSSTCIALGLKDKLVGTEEKTEARPIYKLAAPELIGVAANVGSAKAFDLEACIAAEPDLVILPKKAKDYAATLAEMGIAAIVVNPESHEKLVEMIQLISQLTGSEEAAAQLIARYDEVQAKLETLTAGLTDADKPVVYICNTGSYMGTAPKDMYQASVIRSAGGINAGDELEGDSWVEVSYEQILAMNPDVIIIPTNNMANGQPDYTAADVLADANLAEVTAVKNAAVYNMPAGLEAWDSPVPSGILGMLWMLNTLHPDLYSQEEFVADAADFYSTFYGFEMDSTIITG
jgi:iron complex transport system substrate-binding protein